MSKQNSRGPGPGMEEQMQQFSNQRPTSATSRSKQQLQQQPAGNDLPGAAKLNYSTISNTGTNSARPQSAGKSRKGYPEEVPIQGPAIHQTQNNNINQVIGSDGKPIPGYARPKSAGSIKRAQQLATSTSSPAFNPASTAASNAQYQYQHPNQPSMPSNAVYGYSEQTKHLYYSGGVVQATNQINVSALGSGRPSSASDVNRRIDDRPLHYPTQQQTQHPQQEKANQNSSLPIYAGANNPSDASDQARTSPTLVDTKRIVNVTRPHSAAARIRSEIQDSYKYQEPKSAAAPREGNSDPLGENGDVIRAEALLAKEDDDEMDGYKPVALVSDSRSHPEISATLSAVDSPHPGMAIGMGIDDRGSQDSLIADELIVDIGLSTVPNQFCTVRDAVELKKLLLLSNLSRGGMVPSSTAVMDMYMVGKVVGVGSYGKVRAAWHRLTGSKVAIKTYDKSKLKDPSHWKRVNSEIKIMEQISHPRISRLYEAVETPKRMHLIMECLEGGDLCSYVKQKRRLSEEESRSIFFQVLQAIDYLHMLGVAHRDIKLENVLFVDGKDVKLIDFGFSTVCQEDKRLKVFCGTPSYMAPEIVRRAEYDGRPVDMWSLGIFLYALLCGCFPFRAKSYPDLYRRIARGTFAMPDELSMQVKDLLSVLLHIDADKRITANMAMRHPWLQPCVATATDVNKLRLTTRTLVSDKASDDIDEETLLELSKFGIPREDLVRLIMSKVHSSMTTVYYLLLDIVDKRRKVNKSRHVIAPSQQSNGPPKRAQSAGTTRSSSHNTQPIVGPPLQQAQPLQTQQSAAPAKILQYSNAPAAQQFVYSGNNAASNANGMIIGPSSNKVQPAQRPLSAHAGRKS